MSQSKHLDSNQLASLDEVGDIIIPGDGELPSFSQARLSAQVDRMLDYMNDSDRAGVGGLLTLFRFLPRFAIRGLLLLSERDRYFPGMIGAGLRMINLGIKGVVMTLYYSDVGEGVAILPLIRWETQVVEREPEDPTREAQAS